MSITDVAKKAGVSVSTVSRVLNGRSSVQPALVRRVRDAMEEIGYEPRAVRPGPKPQPERLKANVATGRVGVLLRGRTEALLEFPYVHRLFMALTDEAQRHGYHPLVLSQPNQQVLPRIIRNKEVDGLVLLGGGPISEHADADAFHPLPCVQVGGAPVPLPVIDQVVTGSRAAGILAADYVVAQGRTRPVYLNHVPQHQGFPLRWAGFRDRLAGHGLVAERYAPPSDVPVPPESWSAQDVKSMMGALLDRVLAEAPDTDALFLPTDQQAAACHALLKERGIRPEKDITLISCNNDEPWLVTMDPRSATVDLRSDELGRQAVRRLLQRLEDPTSGPIVSLVTPRLLTPSDE